MACEPESTISSADLTGLNANIATIDVVTESSENTTETKNGKTIDTLLGKLKKLGYEPPIAYAGSIVFTTNDNTKTVDEAGVVYAPLPSLLPFTTSGTFVGDDDARFFVVQGVTESSIGSFSVKPVNTVASIQTATLSGVTAIQTLGRVTIGDGGAALYRADPLDTTSADDGFLVILSSDSVRFKLTYDDGLNVKWSGAVLDGVVDDTASIQKWLSTTDTYLIGSTGVAKVTAKLNSNVENRRIEGNGMIIAPSSSVMLACLDLQADGQIIECFDFQADSAAQCAGIFIGAFSDCELRFNKFSNFDGSGGTDTGSGILCNSAGKDHFIHHNRLINCHFSHAANQYGSIHCNAGGSLIESNKIKDCQQTGVSVAAGSSGGSNYIEIINNTIVGKVAAIASGGVNVDGYTMGTVIRGNNIRDVAVEGILIAGSISAYSAITSDVVILNNTLHECVLNDIALQGSAAGDVVRVLIEGNKCFRSTGTNQAFVMTFADHVDILANQTYGHASAYVVTATSKHHNVNGNTFINAGISCSASESTYSNNKIYGDGATTIGMSFNAIATAGKMQIHGNQVRNCLKGIKGTFNPSLPVYVFDNNLGGNTTDLDYTGELPDSSRDNTFDSVLAGEATLSSGSVAVAISTVVTGDRIEIELKTAAGVRGALYIDSITGGAGFDIKSTSASDTSVIYWRIIR